MRLRSTSSANTPRPTRPLQAGAVVWAGAIAVAAFGLTLAHAHAHAQPRNESALKSAGAPATTSSAATSPKAISTTKPLWNELTAEQQLALKPLNAHWNTMNVGQKKKWLALSRNFSTMSADDQATLHSRMIEWTALSNQQRAQARLNFAEVKRVPADERKAKWEQYQALSEEEKRKLAERATPKPRGAAILVRPVSSQKLVPVPAVTPGGQHTPRILLAPPAPMAAPAAVMVASPPERAAAPGTVPAVSMVPLIPPPAPARVTSPPVPAEAQVPAPTDAPSSSP